MFSSLHSRILMTYILLIGVVLCVVGFALILFILQNPVVDRQVFSRLEVIADLLGRLDESLPQSWDRWETIINRVDQQNDVRVLILSSNGEAILDSRADETAELNLKINEINQSSPKIIIDSENRAWYTVWERLEDDTYLVIATRRVGRVSMLFTQRLRELLRDDLVPPLIQSGLVALLLALILSFLMANWIATPLKRISDATHEVSEGENIVVPAEGPREVQSLAISFNEMVQKVVLSQISQKDFVANISHDLKTPLTSIQGFSQALRDGTIKSETEIKKAAVIIQEEAERMNRMVVNLLDLAQLEAGNIKMKQNLVDLRSLLSEIVEKMEPMAVTKGIEITYSETSLPMIIGDRDRLMQVFNNLIDNAIKFTSPGGIISIRCRDLGKQVLVEIQDTGKSVPQEEANRIFERFYQVDKSRSGGGRGIGLGLSISKEIIEAHNGMIEVRSQVGEGSCFMVKIPTAEKLDLKKLST